MMKKWFLRGAVLCAALVLLTVSAQAATTVNAATSEELLNMLVDGASDLVIQLNGRYEIPAQTPINVSELKNVTIKGAPGTQIVAMECDKPVITLNKCEGVTLDTLILRHDLPAGRPGTSEVLALCNSYNFETLTTGVWVLNCDIYGGKYGIKASGSRVYVENSTIRNCSYYIMSMDVMGDVIFEKCQFLGNGKFDLRGREAAIQGGSCTAEFYRCGFEDNTSVKKVDGRGTYHFDNTCTYRNNGWDHARTGTQSYQVGDNATMVMDWDADELRAAVRGSGPMWSPETMPVIAGYAMDHAVHIAVEPGITDIGRNFSGLGMLGTVSLPGTLREIPDRAFADTKWIWKVEIGEGPTRIGNGAFMNCTDPMAKNFTEFRIPGTVTSIGEKAFYNCRVRKLKVPGSVKEIGTDALEYCVVLDTLYYGGSKEQWAQLANNTGLTDTKDDNLWKTEFAYNCLFFNAYTPGGVVLPKWVQAHEYAQVYAARYDQKGAMLDVAVGRVFNGRAEFKKSIAPNSVLFFANGNIPLCARLLLV